MPIVFITMCMYVEANTAVVCGEIILICKVVIGLSVHVDVIFF